MRKSALLEPFAFPPELRKPLDYIRIIPVMLPILNLVRKFGRLTCKEYFDKLNFKSEKIIVENNTAKGIVLSDGTQILSDYVISAADGYTTIYKINKNLFHQNSE